MDLKGIGWDGVNCIHLAWDRDQRLVPLNVVLNLLIL
jgi:hypothetical protein